MARKLKETLYTKEGFQEILDELDYLKNTKRQEVKDDLAYARSLGDLSENAEYDEARNEQAKVESRILELEDMISNAKIVDESDIDHNKVNLGSKVTVYDKEYEEEVQYLIVGSNEANPLLGKISNQSPVGSALMGKHVGDEVTVEVPSGHMHLKILNITR